MNEHTLSALESAVRLSRDARLVYSVGVPTKIVEIIRT
jgi:hypothetical protein